MSLSALIIGQGSIGKRHVNILKSIKEFGQINVLSSQRKLPYKALSSLDQITDLNPDYIVVASETSKHFSILQFIESNLNGKKILIEKPLFNNFFDLEVKNNQTFVGYNLRFNPLLSQIKDLIYNRELWNIQITCGSYLPEWRSNRDYRKTSSAKKESGGGVLLDLSHELDYAQWIFGFIDIKYVENNKVSSLEIDTDDLLLLYGKTKKGASININLNYFTREPIRQIFIDGEGISIQANLLSNVIIAVKDNKKINIDYSSFDLNETYRSQHLAIIKSDFSKICTYDEGLETMRLIKQIKKLS